MKKTTFFGTIRKTAEILAGLLGLAMWSVWLIGIVLTAWNCSGVHWTAVGNSTFGSDNINSIAYGGGKFIAGGTSGKMAYSTDGTTWTAVGDSTFGGGKINSITYGSGTFVAVGNDGKIATSSDYVLTWAAVGDSAFGSGNIYGIAYGSGMFVAVGNDSKITTSSDNGVTWTAVGDSTFGGGHINRIAYGGGTFVVVGNDGKIATSSDYGLTWTVVGNSAFGSGNIYGIAYGGGRFVAVGNDGKIATSSNNGLTWTAVKDSKLWYPDIIDWGFFKFDNGMKASKLSDINSQFIVYGGGRFVASGADGKMAYSKDGVRWTAVRDSTFVGKYVVKAAFALSISASRNANIRARTYSVPIYNIGNSGNINDIAYGGGKFVACGTFGTIAYWSYP
jgi:hypothetical protein